MIDLKSQTLEEMTAGAEESCRCLCVNLSNGN